MHIQFAMYTFIQLSLKEKFHLNVQAIIIISEIDLAMPHYQVCNMCVWYSLLNVECYISDMFFDISASKITLLLDEKSI